MAIPLRTVMSSKFKSNCAAVGAPPSPTEPISPVPAIVVRRFAALAAAAAVAFGAAGAENEKSLLGLSTEVRSNWSAVAVAADVETSVPGVSLDWGTAARVRTPMFEATIVGGILFQATRAGAVEEGAGAAVASCAGAAVEPEE